MIVEVSVVRERREYIRVRASSVEEGELKAMKIAQDAEDAHLFDDDLVGSETENEVYILEYAEEVQA